MAKGGVLNSLGAMTKDLARGVYSNIDSKAAQKMIKNHATKTGAPVDVAEKMIKNSLNTNSAKLGYQLMDTAPLKGIASSARIYNNSANAGKKVKLTDAIKKGHRKIDANGNLMKEYDKGKIAGTVFSVGVAGRIATGGGLYRDRYGNVNLPGVPFI